MDNGWDASAAAWIAQQGEEGDFGRQYVLDRPMQARVIGRGFQDALDVGCGEGRFCRFLRGEGIAAIGIDPTEGLLAEARRRDPAGEYRLGSAEALPFPEGSFDLVVSYLTLIDIDDVAAATSEMARVLRPGGSLLIANLTSFSTAVEEDEIRLEQGLPLTGWIEDGEGRRLAFAIDRYLEPRSMWVAWRGIRIRNWHRPLSTYMRLLLGAGLELRHFDEPEPVAADHPSADGYRRAPWFLIMEWQKPT